MRQCIEDGKIKIFPISTGDMVADFLHLIFFSFTSPNRLSQSQTNSTGRSTNRTISQIELTQNERAPTNGSQSRLISTAHGPRHRLDKLKTRRNSIHNPAAHGTMVDSTTKSSKSGIKPTNICQPDRNPALPH